MPAATQRRVAFATLGAPALSNRASPLGFPDAASSGRQPAERVAVARRRARRVLVPNAEPTNGVTPNGDAAPKKKRPLPKRDSGGEDDGDSTAPPENELHPSWNIYEEDGNKCVICLGEGKTKCLFCFGEGYIRTGPQPDRDTEVCPVCDGEGVVTCIRCDGTGIRPATRYDGPLGREVRNRTNEEVRLGIGEEEDSTQGTGRAVDMEGEMVNANIDEQEGVGAAN